MRTIIVTVETDDEVIANQIADIIRKVLEPFEIVVRVRLDKKA